MGASIRIGISGWRYKGWRGTFYPKDLAQRRELEYASSHMSTIEINGSFYSLQRSESWQEWYETTPEGFVFSVKGPRFITHMKQLKDCEGPLANFFASGVLRLREKLGPILWQFPPRMQLNLDKFDNFFRLLPRTTTEAAEVAKGHNEKLKYNAWTRAETRAPLRYAVEVRHPSFMVPEFMALLRENNIALVFADTAGLWCYAEDITADFIYIRLHGASELYSSGYSDAELEWWAKRVRAWSLGRQVVDRKCVQKSRALSPPKIPRDVYAYFDNDAKVHAPFDAIRLRDLLGSRSHRLAA